MVTFIVRAWEHDGLDITDRVLHKKFSWPVLPREGEHFVCTSQTHTELVNEVIHDSFKTKFPIVDLNIREDSFSALFKNAKKWGWSKTIPTK